LAAAALSGCSRSNFCPYSLTSSLALSTCCLQVQEPTVTRVVTAVKTCVHKCELQAKVLACMVT
jgi:hypothetical protein